LEVLALQTDRPLNMAVVGVGYLGRHHARILSTLPNVRLLSVIDRDLSRARAAAEASGARVAEHVRDVPPEVEAAVVAVPTEKHAEVAGHLLERGVAVLVEKPMTRSLADADALIAAAAQKGVVVAVGHTERYNPAVTAALREVEHPGFVEVHRLGTFPERSLDIDVVFDLMIHDLDVLLAAVGAEVERIDAVGVPVLTGRVDIANARLRFANGCVANLTASRISRERVRKVRFFQQRAYLSIDYASQEVEVYRLVFEGGRPSIQGGKLDVEREEPLKLELLDFCHAVRGGGQPRVTGEDGRRALELAQRVTDAIG
jgi:predicted dehydrogenase